MRLPAVCLNINVTGGAGQGETELGQDKQSGAAAVDPLHDLLRKPAHCELSRQKRNRRGKTSSWCRRRCGRVRLPICCRIGGRTFSHAR